MTRAPDTARPHRPSPIERFLSPEEAVGGPFALLGVTPQSCTDDAVLTALDRQLDRVAHHIECDTPEADEVRLALHAAAAQLLDPAVRRHLSARWLGQAPPARSPPTTTPARPASAPSMRRTPTDLLLEHDAVLTLGIFGGWNRDSLRRLVALAHARGVSSEHVARALHNLATRRRPRAGSVTVGRRRGPAVTPPPPAGRPPTISSPAVGTARPPAARPLPEQIDPARELLRNALIFGAVGVIAIALLIALVVALLDSPANAPSRLPPAPAPTTSSTPTSDPQPSTTPPQRSTAPRPPDSTELAGALREIASAPEALAVDPGAAVERFEKVVGVLAGSWCRAQRDQLVAAHDAIVEFLYRTGADPSRSERAIEVIGAGALALVPGSSTPLAADPDRIWPSIWSLGMLVRLSREKDLSAAAREAIESRVGAGVGMGRPVIERSFDSGATAALQVAPGLLLAGADAPPLEAWQRWADAAVAVAGTGSAHDAIILAGLDSLLVLGPEPDQQRDVLEAIGDLTTRVSWRQGDEARFRLLRWFEDRRVTTTDLQAITSAIATRSAAEGVDITMVLSPAASERVRADLRERYARVWGIAETVDRGAIALEWEEATLEAIARSFSATTDAEHLAAAALLARLNEAAWRLWKGDNAEAARIILDRATDIDAILQPAATAGPAAAPDDAGWAERYLAARRNVPVRLELLTRLSARAGAIGPVDAEVLAAEALSGTPAEVRGRAAELVRQFGDSPAMVNALLEALPRAPRIVQNSALIASVGQRRLPPLRDPSWPIQARRALVERMLELSAASGDYAAIDQLSRVLAIAYRGLASELPLSATERTETQQPPAHVSAGVLRDRWRDAAGKSVPGPASASGPDLTELDRRHSGRAGLARGLVQAFAAEQVSACELMAYVISAERPAAADRVREVIAELEQRRRASKNILDQLNAAERAAAQLWVARAPEVPA